MATNRGAVAMAGVVNTSMTSATSCTTSSSSLPALSPAAGDDDAAAAAAAAQASDDRASETDSATGAPPPRVASADSDEASAESGGGDGPAGGAGADEEEEEEEGEREEHWADGLKDVRDLPLDELFEWNQKLLLAPLHEVLQQTATQQKRLSSIMSMVSESMPEGLLKCLDTPSGQETAHVLSQLPHYTQKLARLSENMRLAQEKSASLRAGAQKAAQARKQELQEKRKSKGEGGGDVPLDV